MSTAVCRTAKRWPATEQPCGARSTSQTHTTCDPDNEAPAGSALDAVLGLLAAGSGLRACALLQHTHATAATLARWGTDLGKGTEERVVALLTEWQPVLAPGGVTCVSGGEAGLRAAFPAVLPEERVLAAAVPCHAAGPTGSVVLAAVAPDDDRVPTGTAAMIQGAAVALARLLDMDAALVAVRRRADRLNCEASTDPLTGLANLRGLRRWADAELAEARPGSRVIAVAVDLDELKWHNDTYGHAFGDRLIWGAALALRSVAQAGDLVARVGGDEFVLLTRIRGSRELRRLESGVRRALKDAGIRASVGAADGSPDEWEDVWRLADLRMLAGKRANGRLAATDTGRPDRARVPQDHLSAR